MGSYPTLTKKLSIFRQVPLVSTFARLALPQYSREYERQANILGTRILSAAGYSADGLYTFMTPLAELQGWRGTGWFDSHPSGGILCGHDRKYNHFAFEGAARFVKARESVCGLYQLPLLCNRLIFSHHW